jgi:4-hydroxybenzoyl-CoA thioesterase
MRKAFYGAKLMNAAHKLGQAITFGDCDPAGIVFYPNYFAWFDRTFHDWLRQFGGHAKICSDLGSLGIGLMGAEAAFKAPLRDGQTLDIHLIVTGWDRKALRLSYEGQANGRTAVIGTEVRGLFKITEKGMIAADMVELKDYLEAHGLDR